MRTSWFLKKTVLLIAVLFFTRANAQVMNIDPFLTANNDMRAMLGGLQFPANSDKFYDMTVHLSNHDYFTHYYTKANDLNHWLLMYEELYYASQDTSVQTPLVPVIDTLFNFQGQNVPVMLMNYNFHKLFDYNYLADSTYFITDTLAQTVEDNPSRPQSPYSVLNVFTGMVFMEEVHYRNVNFVIDPQFIFYDGYNADDFEVLQFQINFGDGTGYHPINAASLNNLPITYPTSGDFTIEYRIFNPDTRVTLKYSKSNLRVKSSKMSTDYTPDQVISFNGLNIGVYEPCEEIPVNRRKAFIYLTGFDPLNSTTIEEWYEDYVEDAELQRLRNYGHTIYVVKYEDVSLPLQVQALAVAEFLVHLKCTDYNESEEQFTVMGYSMGGLIGRYALLLGENFPQPPGTCEPQRKHNTKLFISADAPQQGANIPLAFQWVWRDGGFLMNAFPMLSMLRYSLLYKLPPLLMTPSVQQMLIYHIDTYNPFTNTYQRHPFGELFFQEMESMGNYPQHCKTIALTNGSLAGAVQQNLINKVPLPPNYRFLDMELQTSVKIFGKTYTILDANTELKSNPLGTGNLVDIDLLEWAPKPKLSWKGLTVNLIPGPGQIYFRDANNMYPLCVASGGANYTFAWGLNLIAQFGLSLSSSVPGLILKALMDQGGMTFSGTSDAAHFNFIPTISAVDYGGTWTPGALGINLRSGCGDPIFDQSPFDVVVGITSHVVNEFHNADGLINRPHGERHANYARDFTGAPLFDISNGFLVREAGDTRLWLDNYETGWSAEYSAFDEVRAGQKVWDDFYWHQSDGCSMPSSWIPGSYSKEQPMVTGSYSAAFIHDHSGVFNDLGVVGSFYFDFPEDMTICEGAFRLAPAEETSTIEADASLLVYPNPANDRIYLSGLGEESSVLQLYSITGELVMEQKVSAEKTSLSLDRSRVKPGLYQLKVIQANDIAIFKVIVR